MAKIKQNPNKRESSTASKTIVNGKPQFNAGKKTEEQAHPKPTRVPHRFRPGTVALREIRKYQKSTDRLMPLAPFRRTVVEVLSSLQRHGYPSYRLTMGALLSLYEATESQIVQILDDCNKLAIHGKRVTIMPKDLRLTIKLKHQPLENAITSEINKLRNLGKQSIIEKEESARSTVQRKPVVFREVPNSRNPIASEKQEKAAEDEKKSQPVEGANLIPPNLFKPRTKKTTRLPLVNDTDKKDTEDTTEKKENETSVKENKEGTKDQAVVPDTTYF